MNNEDSVSKFRMFLNILTDYLFSFKKMVFGGGKKKGNIS